MYFSGVPQYVHMLTDDDVRYAAVARSVGAHDLQWWWQRRRHMLSLSSFGDDGSIIPAYPPRFVSPLDRSAYEELVPSLYSYHGFRRHAG